jgi:hypothetical protein
MTIVSYEGFGGRLGRWVRRGLLNHIKGVKKEEFLWNSGSRDYGLREIIVIGHSFGVRDAVATATRSRNVKLLLLIDPRMPPWGEGGVVAPKGVRTVCFYQTGAMRGHPVEGAENHHVKGVHIWLPWREDVRELVEGLCERC